MGRNVHTKLDQVAQSLPFSPAGKIFLVADSSAEGINDIIQKFGHTIGAYYSTIDTAINACQADRGDIIYVAPNYTQTFTAAAGFALDVAGVSLIGLGIGNNRPVLTYASTDNAATTTQSGNNTRFENFVLVTNDDGLTNNHVVSGNNCYVNIEHQDTSSLIETATAVRLDTADNCILKIKHLGFTGGSGTIALVRLDDCDNVRIEIDAFGLVAATGWVEMVDVASTNVRVTGTFYTQAVTNLSRNVVDTITGSSWSVEGFDASAGAPFSGGSGNAVAVGDLSAIASDVSAILVDTGTTLDALLNVPSADATTNTRLRDVVGNKTDAAIADTIEGSAATTQSLVADVKAILQRIGADSANNTAATTLVARNEDGSILERLEDIMANLVGTAGVVAFPAAVAPANAVSMAEVLRATYNQASRGISKSVTSLATGNLFTVAGGMAKIMNITGYITTAGQALANNVKLVYTPTGGTATDVCAVLDLNAAGQYGILNITGTFANALQLTATAGIKAGIQAAPFLVSPGVLSMNCSASTTGAIDWYIEYMPMDLDATVVAA